MSPPPALHLHSHLPFHLNYNPLPLLHLSHFLFLLWIDNILCRAILFLILVLCIWHFESSSLYCIGRFTSLCKIFSYLLACYKSFLSILFPAIKGNVLMFYVLLICPSWSCIVICCINKFTSLCKNLFNLLEFLAVAFWCHVHHFQYLTVPVELHQALKHWKWWDGIEKLLLFVFFWN